MNMQNKSEVCSVIKNYHDDTHANNCKYSVQYLTMYENQFIVQHKALVGQNIGRFGTARKLVEKILVVDHTNDSSLLELTIFAG